MWTSLFISSLLLVSLAGAADECSAEANAELLNETRTEEEVAYTFEVTVSSMADCAIVDYVLVLEMELPNGDIRKEKRPRQVKLQFDAETTENVIVTMTPDNSLTSYEAKVVRCLTCGP